MTAGDASCHGRARRPLLDRAPGLVGHSYLASSSSRQQVSTYSLPACLPACPRDPAPLLCFDKTPRSLVQKATRMDPVTGILICVGLGLVLILIGLKLWVQCTSD